MLPKDVDTTVYQWKITRFLTEPPNRTREWIFNLVRFWKENFPEAWEPLTLETLAREGFRFNTDSKISDAQIFEELVRTNWLVPIRDDALLPAADLSEYMVRFHNISDPTWRYERIARTREWESKHRK